MYKLLEKVNKLHEEVDRELDEKLQLVEKCIEGGMECPCEMKECNIDFNKMAELDNLYKSEKLEGLDRIYRDITKKLALKA